MTRDAVVISIIVPFRLPTILLSNVSIAVAKRPWKIFCILISCSNRFVWTHCHGDHIVALQARAATDETASRQEKTAASPHAHLESIVNFLLKCLVLWKPDRQFFKIPGLYVRRTSQQRSSEQDLFSCKQFSNVEIQNYCVDCIEGVLCLTDR